MLGDLVVWFEEEIRDGLRMLVDEWGSLQAKSPMEEMLASNPSIGVQRELTRVTDDGLYWG